MTSPALQLDLESALKAYFISENLFAARPIHAAHALEGDPDGTFLTIIAETPDWEQMVVNAVVRVTFEFATVIKNPKSRTAAAVAHQTDLGKIIELFSDQEYPAVLADLNEPPNGLGFTGWEAQPPEPDGTTETQIVARPVYEFEVFLKD